MGGSAHKGNITPTAEFNFHCDPEAAFLVLKKVQDCHALLQDVIYHRSLNNSVSWHYVCTLCLCLYHLHCSVQAAAMQTVVAAVASAALVAYTTVSKHSAI